MVDFVRLPNDGAGKQVTTKKYTDQSNADFYTQVIHVGDRTDPNIAQTVSNDGAAWVEFPAGAPSFNTFGEMLVSESHLVEAIKFYEGPVSAGRYVGNVITGNASVSYESATLSYNLATQAGSGNKVKLGSHKHIGYTPGVNTRTMFVTSADDAGKAGVTRRVGLFTDNDGLFFELANTTVNVVIRDSTSNTEIRVAQANWNNDKLDGSGGDGNRSNATLDISKMNIFWIKYQYLSAGVVEFGCFVDGKSVLLHQIKHFSQLNAPYIGTTYLPIAAEIENTGAAIGPSEWKIHCAAIVREGFDDLVYTPVSINNNSQTITNSGGEQHILSIRPVQTYLGKDNRYRYLPKHLSAISTSESVHIKVYQNATLANTSFSTNVVGLEIDDSSNTTFSGGLEIFSFFVASGQAEQINFSSIINSHTQGFTRHFNITDTDTITITAQPIGASANTQVVCSALVHQVE